MFFCDWGRIILSLSIWNKRLYPQRYIAHYQQREQRNSLVQQKERVHLSRWNDYSAGSKRGTCARGCGAVGLEKKGKNI
mgnify:CR=1 FL=1